MMEYIARVIVKSKDGWFFECQAQKNGTWRCGKCWQGVLEPEESFKCLVCSSEVAVVQQDWERIMRRKREVEEWMRRTEMLREQFEQEVQKMDKGEAMEFRFQAGDDVWVRDRGNKGGYCIVQAKVREQHHHPGRHPGYPNGEGYALDGDLWWDCYPGCRVFGTRQQATAARISSVGKNDGL